MDTKQNNSKDVARAIIAAASKTQLTIIGDAVVRYIIMLVSIVLAELNEAKKHLLGISSQDLFKDVREYIEQEKASVEYASDHALLRDYYRSIRNYVWNVVNRKEAEYIIDKLKNSEQFCSSFFYDNSEKMGAINMGRIVSKIAYEMFKSYHVEMDKREISSIIYEFFWDQGNWSTLDGFRFQSSFFWWLETISRREVIKKLEDLGLIKVPRGKTTGNQRHILLSQAPERCKLIIEEEVKSKKEQQMLLFVYYNRYDEQTIMELLGMDAESFAAAKKKADKHLIEAMLRSTKSYDDILRDKDPRDITVSVDAAMDIICWIESKVGESSLRDIFGINLSDKEIEECAQDILTSVSAKMPWNERDRFIFSSRYFGNEDPVELAEILGVTRTYIDIRFSRLQEKFNKAMRQWAVDMKLLTPEEVTSIERRIIERKAQEKAEREANKKDKSNKNDNN